MVPFSRSRPCGFDDAVSSIERVHESQQQRLSGAREDDDVGSARLGFCGSGGTYHIGWTIPLVRWPATGLERPCWMSGE